MSPDERRPREIVVLMDHVPLAGGTTVAAALMATWAEAGVPCRGVALGRMSPRAAERLPAEMWTVLGGGGHRGRLRNLRRHLARTLDADTVVLAIGEYPALVAVLARMALPRRRRPTIVIAEHQPRSLAEIVADRHPALARPVDQAARWLRRRTAASICLSDEQRDRLIRSGLVTSMSATTIPNPCVLPTASASTVATRLARLDRGETVRLLTVGTVNVAKGQDVLLRAIQGLDPRIRLTHVGSDDISGLNGLATELGISDRVEFLGVRPDIAELMDEHDLFVLPSRYESFGLVVIEALVRGLPVVATAANPTLAALATRTPSMRLAVVDDADDLRRALADLAAARWSADALLETARSVATAHDPERAATAHLALFTSILGRRVPTC